MTMCMLGVVVGGCIMIIVFGLLLRRWELDIKRNSETEEEEK